MSVGPKHEQPNPGKEMRGIASKQLHALCYEHHVKMGIDGARQTNRVCLPEAGLQRPLLTLKRILPCP